MRYINPRFTYLLTYLQYEDVGQTSVRLSVCLSFPSFGLAHAAAADLLLWTR